MILPNGKKIVMAVYVTRAKGEFKDMEEGIEKMAKLVYDYFNE